MKPCFVCHKPAPTNGGKPIFSWEEAFDEWADRNNIISRDRSRFDGVRARLEWAATDETGEGAHPECALKWSVEEEGFGGRYPALPPPALRIHSGN